MIDFKDVTKTYAGDVILDSVTFRVNSGDRVGMVGPNGAGKSTIFGIITGEVVPDRGSVSIPKAMPARHAEAASAGRRGVAPAA